MIKATLRPGELPARNSLRKLTAIKHMRNFEAKSNR
jgi:hypothetical protein